MSSVSGVATVWVGMSLSFCCWVLFSSWSEPYKKEDKDILPVPPNVFQEQKLPGGHTATNAGTCNAQRGIKQEKELVCGLVHY